MYREHVDSDVAFVEQDMAELEMVLHRFIDLQTEKRLELITQSPLHEMSYELFYAKSPATTKRKIKQYIKDIDGRVAEIEAFTGCVKSLKSLKPYLEARHDSLYDQFSLDNSYRW